MNRDGIKRGAAAGSAALLSLALACAAAPAAAESEAAHAPAIIVTANPAPNLFGTATVPIQLSRYAADLERAGRSAAHDPAMQQLVAPARHLDREQQVAFVQAEVHRRIRWVSDATEWGRHDYWASASETLERGAGDMEDRAIVKMQALRTLGFRPGDLFLTFGRDKVGGQIVVLVVQVAKGRFLTLDDLSGPPVPIERREGFEPLMSFAGSSAWLHGRRLGEPSTARR